MTASSAPICILCLVACAATGCAQMHSSKGVAAKWPWQEEKLSIPGVKTSQERIEELKGIVKNGSANGAGLSQHLAKEIQHEQDPQVRLYIIRALSNQNDATAAAVLHAGLEDADESVRIACCEAWGKRGGPEAVDELATVLQAEASVDVRMAAAKALGKTENMAAVKPLASMLANSDPAIQRRAIESLKNVSGEDYAYDIEKWRQYAETAPSQRPPVSVAERLRRMVR